MSQASHLNAAVERHPAGVVLHLAGDVDLATTPAMQAALDGARPPKGMLVLDVSGVDFMDGSGLRVLLAEQRAAAANGHQFAVAGARSAVRHALRATGLDVLLPCAPDWRTALTSPS